MPYVTSGAAVAVNAGADNGAYGADSESFSEEEIVQGKNGRRGGGGAVTRVEEVIRTGGAAAGRGVVDSLETNIERNITKNYYINEEQNYFIQNEPAIQHDQSVQSLPAPTVTTVNMAAERMADNPSKILSIDVFFFQSCLFFRRLGECQCKRRF